MTVGAEQREAARHLVRHPLVTAEHNPDMFALVRRHAQQLDRDFSQQFGYRLRITADTARLYKTTVVSRRPFTTATANPRPFKRREYVMLSLALAALLVGQRTTSLQDLLNGMLSAAVEADVRPVGDSRADRRAVVTALRWLIGHGILEEAHLNIERYADDPTADAILTIRHERAKLLPLRALGTAETAGQLLDRSEQRERQRLRALLLEEPVVYRKDLTEREWRNYRNYRSEMEQVFGKMFGMRIENRAEGMAAIDPDGQMTDVQFPRGGTVPQAALLLIARLCKTGRSEFPREEVVNAVAQLAKENRKFWSALSNDPEQLADQAVGLLAGHRLAGTDGDTVRLRPAAWRYAVEIRHEQRSIL